MVKKKENTGWSYEIVYNKINGEFFTAEVYSGYRGKRPSFCEAGIFEGKLKDMQCTLLNLSLKAASLNYYIWDGRCLKHA